MKNGDKPLKEKPGEIQKKAASKSSESKPEDQKSFWMRAAAFLKAKGWYILILAAATVYVFIYRQTIYQLEEFNAANAIFVLWLILLLLPLFSEMEFFGFKLKRAVAETKAEVEKTKSEVSDLRSQITNIDLRNSNETNIYVTDDSVEPLPQLRCRADRIRMQNIGTAAILADRMYDIMPEKGPGLHIFSKAPQTGAPEEPAVPRFDVPDEAVYLLKVRLTLETALKDLCGKTGYKGKKEAAQMLGYLSDKSALDSNTLELTAQIIRIASRGIHGEAVSSEYVRFIEQAFPALQQQLDETSLCLR